jgi:putative nucleotidyltransferase with HDIG domain
LRRSYGTLGECGNQHRLLWRETLHATLSVIFACPLHGVGVHKDNLRRVLRTVEALSDLGPQITAEHEFPQIAQSMLAAMVEAGGAREGALFVFNDKPSMLTSVTSQGFVLLPDPAVIPLLPKHAHALLMARGAVPLQNGSHDTFLSQNGNVAPEMFKCLAPLRVGRELVGVVALGRRAAEGFYDTDDLESLGLLTSYVALAVHNHNLSRSLAQRVNENLKLLASLHGFHDSALEAFATAIDVKHVNVHGHSLRVGRYAASIAEGLGMESSEVAALRSAGYLHDIGKVAVDKRLFGKATALDANEFQEMADHTLVGYSIVKDIQFPWPKIAEIVRGHHERGDGSGYPDGLRNDELSLPVRIVALADTFDAMTSERPYRERMPLGMTLHELVRLAPTKFDAEVLQALLLQIRRDATGSGRISLLEGSLAKSLAPADIDQLAAMLQHKMSQERSYLT